MSKTKNLFRLPKWLGDKESTANAGDESEASLIPGLGRSPRGEHGNQLQCSCLKISTERGAWWATVHGVTKSCTRLKTHTQDKNL